MHLFLFIDATFFLICFWLFILQLVSESVKAKQSQGLLLSEKQGLAKQHQQLNGSLEDLKSRIAQSEEQVNWLSCN